MPGPLQLSVIADEFREEVYFAGVPRPLQRGVATVVSPVARSMGYRGRYPGYADPDAPEP